MKWPAVKSEKSLCAFSAAAETQAGAAVPCGTFNRSRVASAVTAVLAMNKLRSVSIEYSRSEPHRLKSVEGLQSLAPAATLTGSAALTGLAAVTLFGHSKLGEVWRTADG
jgi:hypothetical protein